MRSRTFWSRYTLIALLTASVFFISPEISWAAPADLVESILGGETDTLEILFMLSLIMLLPSMLIMMTSFTRIIIVLGFLRTSMGLQQSPPNQVLIGIALFLTLFIMQPTLDTIYQEAFIPYEAGEISASEAIDNAQDPLKEFMLKQIKPNNLNLFLQMKNETLPADYTMEDLKDLGLSVIVPAFMTSELKQAFLMGFLLYLPFIIIDMVVASALMSMGMMMLPPAMISMPFKLLLFVLVDGWNLIVTTLVRGFV
ncbi:MAG: flagellar type III secretion system pore protein FliP [Peptococcaceae bacterium]|nr:flagellar type III secretion system pore protein FliP [Peptococcaceae bacterium]